MSSPLVTVIVTVFVPELVRLTWWPSVLVSASSGVMVTVASDSAAVAATVTVEKFQVGPQAHPVFEAPGQGTRSS